MKRNVSFLNLLLTAAIFPLLFGCQKGITDNQANPLLSAAKRVVLQHHRGYNPGRLCSQQRQWPGCVLEKIARKPF